jgi:hypothetical protein
MQHLKGAAATFFSRLRRDPVSIAYFLQLAGRVKESY